MKTNSIKPRDFFETLKEVNQEVLIKEQEALHGMACLIRKYSRDSILMKIADILENEWNKKLPREILSKLKELSKDCQQDKKSY